MRNVLRFSNLIALVSGILGALLMTWIHLGGVDEKQLYPSNHPAWILLMILTGIMLVIFWLLSHHAGNSGSFRGNFPASVPGSSGCLAAGTGLLSAGIYCFTDGTALSIIAGILGVCSGVMLYWSSWCRYLGRKSMFPPHMLPCFFFAAQLFILGQDLGSEPEIYRYLFRFLATLSMLPACYWLWSFDVNLANRPGCLFWCLTAAYCNLVAIIGSQQWFLHLTMVLWLLTNLPVLKFLPRRSRKAPVERPAPAPVDPQNADEILELLIREFGSDAQQ